MSLFTSLIYQPFLNLLVAIYLGLNLLTGGNSDMGIAVVVFTIAFRIILLPLSIASDRTEAERRDIEDRVKTIKQLFKSDPIGEKQEVKKLLKGNRRILISEGLNLTIQIATALMLYRIFAKGLLGEDFHLIYGFMPPIEKPLNLVFLGRYDLTHPNLILNFIQSLTIFTVESLSMLTSPFPVTRKDIIRLQIFLPTVSFLIFAYLPAGKKLFIITTLCFSIILIIFRRGLAYARKIGQRTTPTPPSETLPGGKGMENTSEME